MKNDIIHILIFTSVPRTGDKMAGGVQTVAYNFLKGIAQYQEFQISVVDCFGDEKNDIYIRENNIDYYYVASPKPKIFSRIIREIPKLKKLITKIDPDLIHAHTTSTAYIALQIGKPTLLTPHLSILETVKSRKGFKDKLNAALYAYLESQVLKKVRHIIQITPYIYDAFKMRTKATFYPIENPIDAKFFDTIDRNPEENFILFVGKVDDRKSPLHLLMAYQKIVKDFVDVRIKIVGPLSDGKYLQNMKEYCRENCLDSVEFTGPKSKDEVLSLYRKCLFLVLPSKQEAAPMVIAEAMASGKPVIASNVSGNPWMVKEGETGFLYEYGDIDTLAAKMRILLADSSLRKKLGNVARGEAYGRFHPDEVVKKTVEIYRQILEEAR